MTQKELGYIELEWTCKHCGTVNPGMSRVCSNCGAPIAKDDQFQLPDQQEIISDKQKLEDAQKGPAIHCPYCNALNPAGTKLCSQCGGDIEAGLARQAGTVLGAYATAPVPDKPCPFCGQPVKANAQRCPSCGGDLVALPAATPPSASIEKKKTPLWMILGIVAVSVVCLAGIIIAIVMSTRTSDVTGIVSAATWQRSIEILARQPVQKSAWSEEVPADAQDISCRDEYKETSSFPVPNATEVCGTAYVVDQGSGAGKVVQDCEYRVYSSHCDFTVLDWVVTSTAVSQGSGNEPYWPEVNLQSAQQEGNRSEVYQVTFDASGETYTYSPADLDEFRQFNPGSQWVLSINAFGAIRDLRQK